jgi:methionyl-tRNA formyltransferase
MLSDTLPQITSGNATTTPQDNPYATYCGKITSGYGYISWIHQPALEYALRICALRKEPGAWTTWNNNRLKIVDMARKQDNASVYLYEDTTYTEAPGTVIRTQSGQIGVVCADGRAVLLKRVMLAGGTSMLATDFARGKRDWVGSTMGG